MHASCHLNPNKGIWAGQQALSRGLYTNVTECSCFSVFADKLFKVLGMSVILPPSTLPPLFPILCLLLFHERSHKYKSRRMQSVFFSLFFAMFCLPHFLWAQTAVGPTCRRVYCKENKDEMLQGTTSDGDSLLLPPFHHFCFPFSPLSTSSHSLFTTFFSLDFSFFEAATFPVASLQRLM